MSRRESTEIPGNSQESGFSWHTALFVTLLSLARIAHGFFWAIPGPTLPSLELNVRNRGPWTYAGWTIEENLRTGPWNPGQRR